MLNNIKIWFGVKFWICTNGISSYTTEGTTPRYFLLPKIPKVFDYVRDLNGHFYKIADPIFYHKGETEITVIKVDESDSLWNDNTKEGNYILLPL